MTEAERQEADRKEMMALAKKGELFDAAGNKINMFHQSLRAPKPVPPPPKSDIAQALEFVAKAMKDMQQSAETTKEVQADAIVASLQQNGDVLAAVKEALAETQPEKQMEEFDVVFRRGEKGITGARIKQVK